MTVLNFDTQKGSTEAVEVAAFYKTTYNPLIHKNKICKNEKKNPLLFYTSIKAHAILYTV